MDGKETGMDDGTKTHEPKFGTTGKVRYWKDGLVTPYGVSFTWYGGKARIDGDATIRW